MHLGEGVLSVHHIKEDIQAIHMLMQRGDLERRGEKGKCAIERRWKERGGEVEGGRGLKGREREEGDGVRSLKAELVWVASHPSVSDVHT